MGPTATTVAVPENAHHYKVDSVVMELSSTMGGLITNLGKTLV